MEEIAKTVKEKENKTTNEEVEEFLERIPKLKDEESSLDQEIKEVICPHCGLDTNKPRIEVSDEDRHNWIRHILSGGSKRFTKDYEVYGGRIKFRMRSRNGLEDRDVDIATEEFMRSITNTSDFNKLRIEMMKIQLLYSLEYIFYIDLENPESTRRVPIKAPTREDIEESWAVDKSAAIKKYVNFLEETPTPIMSLLCDKLAEFNSTVSMLTIEGLNPDF